MGEGRQRGKDVGGEGCKGGLGDCVTHLANGFLVSNGVGSRRVFVTRLESVAYKRRTKRFDHEVVVVQSSDDDGGVNAGEGG